MILPQRYLLVDSHYRGSDIKGDPTDFHRIARGDAVDMPASRERSRAMTHTKAHGVNFRLTQDRGDLRFLGEVECL